MMMNRNENPNITADDIATVRDVQKLMQAILAVPAGPLEHAIQVAHETRLDPEIAKRSPPEYFRAQGVTRQALRLFWNFRCRLEAAMPQETRG